MKPEYLRIALQLMDVNVNDAFCDLLTQTIELVEKKKGKADLKAVCKLRAKIETLYAEKGIVYPDHKEIASMKRELHQRRNQLLDIHQMSGLLISNADLRPRVWRGIAGDINNRCTD